MSFIYKKITEEGRKEIEIEAKRIMSSFISKLSEIEELTEEGLILRDFSFREEKISSCKKNFKQKILNNAPKKNKDFILSEKKKW